MIETELGALASTAVEDVKAVAVLLHGYPG